MAEKPKEKVIDYAPKTEEKPSGRGIIAALAFLLLLTWAAMAGGFIYLEKKPAPKPVDVSPQIEALRSEKAILAREVNALREALGNVQQSVNVALDDATSSRVEAIERSIRALEANIAELQQMERGQPQAAENPSALMLAALNLRQRITQSLPYEADLVAFEVLAQTDEELSRFAQGLRRLLAAGVPGTAALLKELKGIERELIAASQDTQAGWRERLKQAFTRLVTVRKLGEEQDGNAPEAVVARAERMLEEGRVADALREVEGLPRPTLKISEEWRRKAEFLTDLERQFARIYTRITARVEAPTEPPMPVPMGFPMPPEAGAEAPLEE